MIGLLSMPYRLIMRPEAELDIQAAFKGCEAQTSGLGSECVRTVDAYPKS